MDAEEEELGAATCTEMLLFGLGTISSCKPFVFWEDVALIGEVLFFLVNLPPDVVAGTIGAEDLFAKARLFILSSSSLALLARKSSVGHSCSSSGSSIFFV